MTRELIRTDLNISGKLTRTGWQPPKNLSIEQWVGIGKALTMIESAAPWWIADWWATGEHLYGQRIEAFREQAFGHYSWSTLKTYGWVARSVTRSNRLDLLTFTHHLQVADLPSVEQSKWLKLAIKNQWSANQLKAVRAQQAALARTKQIDLDAAALGKFVILYADPPWRYEHPPMGGSNRSIENQYPTMTLEEICALPVGDLAYDHSMLFVWSTNPKLRECIVDVIEGWGFEYRTNMAWIKDSIGMGYHVREQHELLLLGKRGELAQAAHRKIDTVRWFRHRVVNTASSRQSSMEFSTTCIPASAKSNCSRATIPTGPRIGRRGAIRFQ
jgi:N6-adenosine-specific RNA methylase IME4